MLILLQPLILLGQDKQIDYDFKIVLLDNEKTLRVSQTIQFINPSQEGIDEIYLNDWSHAYSSSKSPLAQRFAEEYDRGFYFKLKSKLGETKNLKILLNGNRVNWSREDNQLDIIHLKLKDKLSPNQTLTLELQYDVILPDASYTGYGVINNEEYYLKNTFIHLAPYINGKWVKNSNLDIEEISTMPANYSMEWNTAKDLFINTNLSIQKEVTVNDRIIRSLSIEKTKQVQFHISKKEYTKLTVNNFLIETNFDEIDKDEFDPVNSLTRIDSFVTEYFGDFPKDKILISTKDYKKRPYFGLSIVSSIFNPFTSKFEFEIKALSVYLRYYLNERYLVNPRENFWLIGGLHNLMMMEYVDRYYPNEKLLGTIPQQPILKPFLKNYSLSKASFNDAFLFFSEYPINRNIQQSPLIPKNELIKFNERISTSSYVAQGIRYAYKFQSKEKVNMAFQNQMGKIKSQKQILDSLNEELDASWLFKGYLEDRNSVDLKLKSVTSTKDSLFVEIKQKQSNLVPFTIAQIKNDSIVESIDLKANTSITNVHLKNLHADYIAINPSSKLPEINKKNNWKKISGLKIKPLKFSFIKDLEDPKRNQLFYIPRFSYTEFDGVVFGTKISNNPIQRKPLNYGLNVNYSHKQKGLIGSYNLGYRLYDENSPYYLYLIGVNGGTSYYDDALRYNFFSPSFLIAKRPNNFRSNKKEFLRLSMVGVNKEKGDEPLSSPNYNIGDLRYIYSNEEAVKSFRITANVEFSDLFGKANFVVNYHRLFHDGRSFSFRFFGGKFLWDNTLDENYFDYSLNRSRDYLFQYQYLGRFNDGGFLSQQFIISEGAFKSKFKNPNSNDFILSTNFTYSIWKWVEAYADFGITKSIDTSAQTFYDSGIRLNITPGYLELYFPIQSSENFALNDNNYLSNMRFIFTLNLVSLQKLFSRRWF